MTEKELLQIGESHPRIQYVFHENYVLVAHRLVHVFRQSNLASRIPSAPKFVGRARTISVTGDADKIEGRVQFDLPRQVGEKNRSAFQYAHKNDRLAGKIAGNVGAQ